MIDSERRCKFGRSRFPRIVYPPKPHYQTSLYRRPEIDTPARTTHADTLSLHALEACRASKETDFTVDAQYDFSTDNLTLSIFDRTNSKKQQGTLKDVKSPPLDEDRRVNFDPRLDAT